MSQKQASVPPCLRAYLRGLSACFRWCTEKQVISQKPHLNPGCIHAMKSKEIGMAPPLSEEQTTLMMRWWGRSGALLHLDTESECSQVFQDLHVDLAVGTQKLISFTYPLPFPRCSDASFAESLFCCQAVVCRVQFQPLFFFFLFCFIVVVVVFFF